MNTRTRHTIDIGSTGSTARLNSHINCAAGRERQQNDQRRTTDPAFSPSVAALENELQSVAAERRGSLRPSIPQASSTAVSSLLASSARNRHHGLRPPMSSLLVANAPDSQSAPSSLPNADHDATRPNQSARMVPKVHLLSDNLHLGSQPINSLPPHYVEWDGNMLAQFLPLTLNAINRSVLRDPQPSVPGTWNIHQAPASQEVGLSIREDNSLAPGQAAAPGLTAPLAEHIQSNSTRLSTRDYGDWFASFKSSRASPSDTQARTGSSWTLQFLSTFPNSPGCVGDRKFSGDREIGPSVFHAHALVNGQVPSAREEEWEMIWMAPSQPGSSIDNESPMDLPASRDKPPHCESTTRTGIMAASVPMSSSVCGDSFITDEGGRGDEASELDPSDSSVSLEHSTLSIRVQNAPATKLPQAAPTTFRCSKPTDMASRQAKSATMVLNEFIQSGGQVIFEGLQDLGHTDAEPKWACHVYVNGQLLGSSHDHKNKRDAKESAATEAAETLGLI